MYTCILANISGDLVVRCNLYILYNLMNFVSLYIVCMLLFMGELTLHACPAHVPWIVTPDQVWLNVSLVQLLTCEWGIDSAKTAPELIL